MPEWNEGYNYPIGLGNQLPTMPVAFKMPANRITCNSQLYFYVYYAEDRCHTEAEASTPIAQGLATLLSPFAMAYPDRKFGKIYLF